MQKIAMFWFHVHYARKFLLFVSLQIATDHIWFRTKDESDTLITMHEKISKQIGKQVSVLFE